MSEIKGQLLGIMLVLILFGSLSAVLIVAFNKMTTSVDKNVDGLVSSLDDETLKLMHY